MKIVYPFALAVLLAAQSASAQATYRIGLRLGGNFASRSGDDPSYKGPSSSGGTTATSSTSYTRKGLLAPQAGLVAEIAFGKLAIQPAVLLTQKGVDQRASASGSSTSGYPYGYSSSYKDNYHIVSRPNYLEIPINFVYTTGGDHGFQFFAGPYMAFGVGGQTELERESSGTSGSSSNSYNYYDYGKTFFYYRDEFPGGQPTANNPAAATPFEASSGALVARRFDAGLNGGIGYRKGALQAQLGYGLGLINQQPAKAANLRDDLPAYYQRVTQLNLTYFFGPTSK